MCSNVYDLISYHISHASSGSLEIANKPEVKESVRITAILIYILQINYHRKLCIFLLDLTPHFISGSQSDTDAIVSQVHPIP